MKSSKLLRVTAYLRRIILQPRSELNRAQQMLRFMLDLGRHGWRQLKAHQASQLAAALTYRTIFSLVPIAVLGALMFKAFYSQSDAQEWLRNATYQQLGFNALNSARDDAGSPKNKKSETPIDKQLEVSSHIDREIQAGVDKKVQTGVNARIDKLVSQVWELDVGAIGIPGVVLFIWAALALFVTVEESFNIVCNCHSGRSWPARITLYWAFLTLGPVLLFTSFLGVSAVLGPLLGLFTSFTGFVASWFLLLLLYLMMPNTPVSLRPALIGSFVAAVSLELAKWAFDWYVATALPYSVIYGSLALIPLFLFWLYLIWLIVLYGLELTSTLQSLRGRNLEEQEAALYRDRLLCDPQWLIPIMSSIGEAFVEGKTVSDSELCQTMALPVKSVVAMCERLERAGFLHKLPGRGRGEPQYTLAKPPDQIEIAALLDLGQTITVNRQPAEANHQGWSFIARLFRAQQGAAKNVTLAKVIEADGSAG